ncbi:hypothetical protein [Devosia nitrariae]|uniref:DUF2336 domain-containing protein n=1 Tax=Devosia nitrariae TaxID=2071872 RepID=A0ABQ5W5D2_9HYPH|nr:hypothetical protein [Devosia nitrariae]GLQ55057.1 hypothetical protein GCM10010862_23160 [Devosia nitrariae]
MRPFAGLIDSILVEEPADFAFDGSLSRLHAVAAWVWMTRDLAGDAIDSARVEDGSLTAGELEPVLPLMLTRAAEAIAESDRDSEARRRLRVQLGGDEAAERLPVLMAALRGRALLVKAQAFGKAVNGITEEAGLVAALQSMPLNDRTALAFLMHAAMGQVSNPSRLAAAALKLSGSASEAAVVRAGYAPLIDAMLAHAQNQLHVLQPSGPFADIDLVCQSLDRFHRLVRAVTSHVELERNGRWSLVLSRLTRKVSERIEPRLRNVVPDLNGAMRRLREADRLDPDQLLAALNGIYLLATLRDCKDSLALNAAFEQTWLQSGQALELHLNRNLELLRANPDDAVVGKRLDVGIKMAEIRFNPEYAETLRRARATAMKR